MAYSEHKKIIAKQIAIELTFKSLKDEVKVMSINHFKKSFEIEAFNDVNIRKWKPLKRERTRYKGNKILTQTGKLKNSIRARTYVGKKIWWIEAYSNVIYANIHNDGLIGKAWGKHSFKMPKRKFMGDSKLLDRKIQRRINYRLSQVFK